MIDPQLYSVDTQAPSADRHFRSREFRRLIAFVRPFRGMLAGGLLLTILFAGLHTVSVAGAFPVFQILLEEEGIGGWIDRTVAGRRLGVTLVGGGALDTTSVRSVAAHRRADSPLLAGDILEGAEGDGAQAVLRALARAPQGESVSAIVIRDGQRRPVTLTPDAPDGQAAWLLRAASWVPADANTARGKLRSLAYILVGMVSVVVAANFFRYLGEVLISKAVLLSMMDLRARLYERVLLLPMSFFASGSTADLVTRFVQDIQEIQRGLTTFFGKFLREPLRAVLILGWALALDWRITLTMLVLGPLTVVLFWAIGRSVKNANRRLLQHYGQMIAALTASLQNLRVVKAYTAEAHERRRLSAVDQRMFHQQLTLAKLQAFVTPAIETLAVVAGSVVTVWLAGRVLDQELSMSKFVTIGVTLSVLFDPLRKLSDVYVRVQRSTAGAERIFQVIDQPTELSTTDSRVPLAPLRQGIEFVDVSFSYPGAATPALRNVSLAIHQGETLAIVGPNGSGKTTLVSMLPRFFDPDHGVIRYDGIDLRQAELVSLRRQFGLVSQDPVVFEGTPLENIAYGVAAAERDKVEAAARRAFADEFIRQIPGGYETTVGERGNTLSGGQRQRIAIARAVYRDAPILIFDEATSQIDSESEQKIQAAVREFARARTTVIIAHRLSTIQFADRIVVMDAGRIVDSGCHKELFDRCLLYRTLCETQFVTEASAPS